MLTALQAPVPCVRVSNCTVHGYSMYLCRELIRLDIMSQASLIKKNAEKKTRGHIEDLLTSQALPSRKEDTTESATEESRETVAEPVWPK